eukprot:2163128-Amphidinium_carterae.1
MYHASENHWIDAFVAPMAKIKKYHKIGATQLVQTTFALSQGPCANLLCASSNVRGRYCYMFFTGVSQTYR